MATSKKHKDAYKSFGDLNISGFGDIYAKTARTALQEDKAPEKPQAEKPDALPAAASEEIAPAGAAQAPPAAIEEKPERDIIEEPGDEKAEEEIQDSATAVGATGSEETREEPPVEPAAVEPAGEITPESTLSPIAEPGVETAAPQEEPAAASPVEENEPGPLTESAPLEPVDAPASPLPGDGQESQAPEERAAGEGEEPASAAPLQKDEEDEIDTLEVDVKPGESQPTPSGEEAATLQAPPAEPEPVVEAAGEKAPPEEPADAPDAGEAAPAAAQAVIPRLLMPEWSKESLVAGRFNIEDAAGDGSLGRTFLAANPAWSGDLAIKGISSSILKEKNAREDFIQACQAWAGLGLHPNITFCFHAGEMDGSVAILHQLDPGTPLSILIQEEKIQSWRRVIDILIQCLDGLEFAWEKGTCHGNLKPCNCIMSQEGTIKVADIGIIKGLKRAEPSGVKDSDTVDPARTYVFDAGKAGSPGYMAPEVWEGGVDAVSPQSDLYSLGVMMYEMLCGRRPFDEGTAVVEKIRQAHMSESPGSPAELKEGLPASVGAFALKCLEKDPGRRPAGFAQAREELKEVYQQAAGKNYYRARPDTGRYAADGLNNRALALLDQGRKDEAEEMWEEALKARPGHVQTTFNRGIFRWRTGRITDVELIGILEGLVSADPSHWLPRYLLGMAHGERWDGDSVVSVLGKTGSIESGKNDVVSAIVKAKSQAAQARGLLRVMKGHNAPVFSVRFSADGRQALSGSMDKTLKLWDVETGKCVKTLEGHRGYVNAIDISPDGKFALSGGGELISEHFDLNYWNLETGERIHAMKGHTGLVRALAISPDGKSALSGGTDNLLKLWSLADGKCVRTMEGHTEWVNSISFTGDGSLAISASGTPRGSGSRSLKLWRLETGECVKTIEGHTASINTVCLSSDGKFALSGSGNPGEQEDNTLRIWDVESGECLKVLKGHSNRVNAAACSPDGRHAVSGGEDCTLRLWELETGRCLRTFSIAGTEINSLAVSPDGKFAIAGCADSVIQYWDISCLASPSPALFQVCSIEAARIDISDDESFDVAMGRARQALAFSDFSAAAHWLREARANKDKERDPQVMEKWMELYSRLIRKEPRGGWEARTFEGHTGGIMAVQFLEKTKSFLSGGADGRIKLWSLSTGECTRTFADDSDEKSGIASLSATRDEKLVLSGGINDRKFRLWNVETGQCARVFEAFKNPGRLISIITPDGRLAFCASSAEDQLMLFDAATGRLLRKYDGQEKGIDAFAISRDQRYLLTGGKDGSINVWETATGNYVRTMKGRKMKGVQALAISDNGSFALSGSADKSIRLWEIESGKCIYIIRELQHPVTSLAMSSDTHYAISSYGDTVKIWDLTTGQFIISLEGHRKDVHSVCLSGDGGMALSGSDDKTVKQWILDWNVEDKKPAEWDEGARPYMETFLELHTPFAGEIPDGKKIPQNKLQAALSRKGTPQWSDDDFQEFFRYLGSVGYGWLRPDGVRKELEKMSKETRESWLSKVFSLFTK
jgi:WD40 repeat protein